MGDPKRGSALGCVLSLVCVFSPPLSGPAAASDSSVSNIRHDLYIQIDTERHALVWHTDAYSGSDAHASPFAMRVWKREKCGSVNGWVCLAYGGWSAANMWPS